MRWHRLRIVQVQPETDAALLIGFEVPPDLRSEMAYQAGQFLSLRAWIQGEEVRRSYSLCSSPLDSLWQVGVKRVPGGVFSHWLHEHARPGLEIEVAPPEGRFVYRVPARPEPEHLLLVAGGSGITPILSIVQTALRSNPLAQVSLVYGNRRVRDIMFKEALEDLRDLFHDRFQLLHCLSKERQEAPLAQGRIDHAKMKRILGTCLDPQRLTGVYVCGPGDMAEACLAAAREAGVAEDRLHREWFAAPDGKPRAQAVRPREQAASNASRVRITVDGLTRELSLAESGPAILDAALAEGIELPYSCKAGVCCTCRARLLSGTVHLDAHHSLTPAELASGHILTCQAHPTSATVELSFDAR